MCTLYGHESVNKDGRSLKQTKKDLGNTSLETLISASQTSECTLAGHCKWWETQSAARNWNGIKSYKLKVVQGDCGMSFTCE